MKNLSVDTIACISLNDTFVLKAWKEDLKIGDEVLILFDGNGDFTKAIGVELNLSDKPVGLGVRSRRYTLLAEGGIVKILNLEEGGAFTFSSGDDILRGWTKTKDQRPKQHMGKRKDNQPSNREAADGRGGREKSGGG
ncbi:hypothetical protein TIFTF001_009794 [Ficus carica]|uniref:glutaredoxin-dependent peroxiredoxin n=1 Tax=Ficus carica TaxID=3494 RepID=A0AA87ZQJ6_FICCA|nr:hypothetical protein TIFTF001_009794 [Ficus carica]